MGNSNKAFLALRNSAFTILNTANDSSEIDLLNGTPVGIYVPSAITGSQLKFKGATAIGGTYSVIADGTGNDYTVTCTAATAKYVPLDPKIFVGVRALKVTAVTAQSGDAAFTLVKRSV